MIQNSSNRVLVHLLVTNENYTHTIVVNCKLEHTNIQMHTHKCEIVFFQTNLMSCFSSEIAKMFNKTNGILKYC